MRLGGRGKEVNDRRMGRTGMVWRGKATRDKGMGKEEKTKDGSREMRGRKR